MTRHMMPLEGAGMRPRHCVATARQPVVEPVPPVLEDELVLAADDEFEAEEALIGTTGSLPAKIC